MDPQRLTTAHQITGVAAAVLLVCLFLPWYGIDLAAGSTSFNAWDAFGFIDLLLFVLVAIALGMVALRSAGRQASTAIPLPTIVTVLGGLATVLVIYRILDVPGDSVEVLGGVGLDPRWGSFLGLLGVIGTTVGGWMTMQEDQVTFSHAREVVGGAIGRFTRPAPTVPASGPEPAEPPSAAADPSSTQAAAASGPEQPVAPHHPPVGDAAGTTAGSPTTAVEEERDPATPAEQPPAPHQPPDTGAEAPGAPSSSQLPAEPRDRTAGTSARPPVEGPAGGVTEPRPEPESAAEDPDEPHRPHPA
ncbi:MAG: hypothetical protein ACR2NA_06515 [Solirubrobacterales bacterium]